MKIVLLACLLAPAVCVAQQGAKPSYLQPGTPQVGGVHHMCLIYHGRQVRPKWTAEALLPYVAYVDERGEPTDWLFDSFLFIEFMTDGGAFIHTYSADRPQMTAEDWQWLADCWFRPDAGLIGLEQAMALAGQKLGEPEREAAVVIAMPFPPTQLTCFGPLAGEQQELNFSAENDRRRAMAWYIDRVLTKWKDAAHEHLRLAGLYWTNETIPSADSDLVRWTADHLHQRDLKLYWVPYFGGTGVAHWRELGIDAMMLQPNYFFQDKPDTYRLLSAAKKATMAHSGLEIEFDGRALTSEDFRERFYAYLDAGVKYGWMQSALLGYYEGGGAIGEFVRGGPSGRELYDAVCRFVKGTYTPSGLTDLSDLEFVVRDNSRNQALAAKGAKVHGGLRPEEHPELAPEKIIDGDIYLYGGLSGFGYFAIPGSFTIELPAEAVVARTQTMLFDTDGRVFRYRIDTSLDNVSWQPAVDKSEGDWRGWQVDRFEPRKARYVRFTGLYNSVNNLCQVIELEVYAQP